MDVRSTVGRRIELPLIVEIFEWAFDIIHADASGTLLHDPAGESLLERIEADDEVGDRLRLARRADPHRDDPGQELVVPRNVGNEVEQLLGRKGQMLGLAMARHQPLNAPAGPCAQLASSGSRRRHDSSTASAERRRQGESLSRGRWLRKPRTPWE